MAKGIAFLNGSRDIVVSLDLSIKQAFSLPYQSDFWITRKGLARSELIRVATDFYGLGQSKPIYPPDLGGKICIPAGRQRRGKTHA